MRITRLFVLLLVMALAIALLPTGQSARAQDEMAPSVTVTDQVITDATVTIESVNSVGPGFIVIHVDNGEGGPGPVIGNRLLSPGWNTNVKVPIDANATTPTMFAMLHTDSGELGVYEFGTVDGADGPVTDADGAVITPSFNAAVMHIHDQLIEGDAYVASSVTVSAPSWLVIHSGDAENFGGVLGQTLVEAGTTAGVSVALAPEGRTDVLWPMLHVDDGEVGTYEFGTVDGADGPVVLGGRVATAPVWTVPHIRVAPQSVTLGDGMTAGAAPVLRVNSVLAAEAGWLVIHQEADGAPGPVAGLVAVPAGLSHGPSAVEVELDPAMLTGNLWPMLHVDTGEVGVYEFGTVEGADGPVSVNDAVVTYAIAASPSITYNGVLDGDVLTIDQALIDAPGWLVIHVDNGDGTPGPVIGQALLTPGLNWNVAITIDTSAATETLFPMLHYDTGTPGVYEFGTVEGADSPVAVGGAVVVGPLVPAAPAE